MKVKAFLAQSQALLHPDDVRERPFTSAKQVDDYCKENGLAHYGNTMPDYWKDLRKKRERDGR